MATNLSLDPKLIERALEVSGERTKKAAVTRALEEFITRRSQKRLVELMGKLEWDESFDYGASDIEFGWRAQLAGFRVAFEPRAVIQKRFRDRPAAVARQHFRSAMSEPHLYRRYRAHGMPRSNLLRALLSWCWLGLTAVSLVTTPQRRGSWLRRAAVRSGRICGSVRWRSLYL